MEARTRVERIVDVVICLDGTGSMSHVRKAVLDLPDHLKAGFAANGRPIAGDGLRVKVIVFRDYKYDDDPPMEESPFFRMDVPAEAEAFRTFVNGVEFAGGGDVPENALEALYLAMKSDWTRRESMRGVRHLVFLLTDAEALPLNDPERRTAPGYPADAPEDFGALMDIFESGRADMGFCPGAAALVAVVPEFSLWNRLDVYNRVYRCPMTMHHGEKELDLSVFDAIIC